MADGEVCAETLCQCPALLYGDWGDHALRAHQACHHGLLPALCALCARKRPASQRFTSSTERLLPLTQSSSLLGVSHLGMLECVYVHVCPQPSKPLSLPDDSQAWTCLFSGHKADLQGASQGLSLLFFQMLISMHPSGISHLLTSSHVFCVIFFAFLESRPHANSERGPLNRKDHLWCCVFLSSGEDFITLLSQCV